MPHFNLDHLTLTSRKEDIPLRGLLEYLQKEESIGHMNILKATEGPEKEDILQWQMSIMLEFPQRQMHLMLDLPRFIIIDLKIDILIETSISQPEINIMMTIPTIEWNQKFLIEWYLDFPQNV